MRPPREGLSYKPYLIFDRTVFALEKAGPKGGVLKTPLSKSWTAGSPAQSRRALSPLFARGHQRDNGGRLSPGRQGDPLLAISLLLLHVFIIQGAKQCALESKCR